MIAQEHIAWCKALFATLKDGARWGVPRSGLIYERRGDALCLVSRMPHSSDMPISAVALRELQDEEYRIECEHFNAAGILVKDET